MSKNDRNSLKEVVFWTYRLFIIYLFLIQYGLKTCAQISSFSTIQLHAQISIQTLSSFYVQDCDMFCWYSDSVGIMKFLQNFYSLRDVKLANFMHPAFINFFMHAKVPTPKALSNLCFCEILHLSDTIVWYGDYIVFI